ncbi:MULTISPECIES: NADPH-dependent FMN reductase [Micrococcales]|uniref:FMN reductase n=1 Tax=Sediminivirga luteola TaxID=1774748 RepID=A0A8J2TYA1_9MICO|nr:NAD(P)H-dependent oxidoreductase [Sediminivirga luteola]MCC5782014.1 NADPH-dependent FMN reductase [Kocuria sp. CCUG 69068]GGA16056.1 FMN reductase [Sediminivirga luteola]
MTSPRPQPTEQQTAPAPAQSRIAVISSSIRDDRMSPSIADWVLTSLAENHGIEVDLIDLAQIALPDDNLLSPGGGPATEVGERIEAAAAFVFVTPEYNHSYPASLKRLIDWHYTQWKLKPATIVAYGVHGGYSAIEHLRGVLAELNMVTTRRCLGLPAPWEAVDDAERFAPSETVAKALEGALAELAWWADLLTDARAHHPFPN